MAPLIVKSSLAHRGSRGAPLTAHSVIPIAVANRATMRPVWSLLDTYKLSNLHVLPRDVGPESASPVQSLSRRSSLLRWRVKSIELLHSSLLYI